LIPSNVDEKRDIAPPDTPVAPMMIRASDIATTRRKRSESPAIGIRAKIYFPFCSAFKCFDPRSSVNRATPRRRGGLARMPKRATFVGMQTAHKPIARTSTTNRSAVTNGSKLLVGIDGRSPTARRFRDLMQAFEAEIGGDLTEVERGLVKQAAALTLRSEQMQADIVNGKPVDSDALIRISSTAKRILGAIGERAGKRKPAVPSLHDHIAANYATTDASEDEGA
jgi:hypothetical protein